MADTDVLVSGIQGDLELPFQVDYKLYGMSFIFGKKGGVSIGKTLLKARPLRLFRDILRLPVKQYDLVLSDFEPVSSWACKLRNHKCIGVSHQNAVLHPNAPKPKSTDVFGKFILTHYAPAKHNYGFHFESLDEQNFTPVIRPLIREAKVRVNNHYTVYLPAYDDKTIFNNLSLFQDINWEVFSKHCKKAYKSQNVQFHPVSLEGFTESFTSCNGILCTAGFETPAEAIFMGKKLCVVPMKNQYEQSCNAAFLEKIGITVLPELENHQETIRQWLNENQRLVINYPDNINEILERIVFSA